VKAVDAICNYLRMAGAKWEGKEKELHWGARSYYLARPGGERGDVDRNRGTRGGEDQKVKAVADICSYLRIAGAKWEGNKEEYITLGNKLEDTGPRRKIWDQGREPLREWGPRERAMRKTWTREYWVNTKRVRLITYTYIFNQ
jgi:hypothetical protein